MYVDVDKAVAQALSIRIAALERRMDGIESNLSGGRAEASGANFKEVCQSLGFSEKDILSHDRRGDLQDARYEVARILIRGGLTIREVSRIMRRSCRSIQRMV